MKLGKVWGGLCKSVNFSWCRRHPLPSPPKSPRTATFCCQLGTFQGSSVPSEILLLVGTYTCSTGFLLLGNDLQPLWGSNVRSFWHWEAFPAETGVELKNALFQHFSSARWQWHCTVCTSPGWMGNRYSCVSWWDQCPVVYCYISVIWVMRQMIITKITTTIQR